MAEYYNPPAGLGQIQGLDLAGSYSNGVQIGQRQQQLNIEQEKARQSQALQKLKIKGLNDPATAEIVARLDPEYGKQLQEYHAKKAIYYGSQAQAINALPIANRNAAYGNLYNKAKASGEDVSIFPIPDGEWSDVKQAALKYIVDASIEPTKKMELAQKDRELELKTSEFVKGKTGEPGAIERIADKVSRERGISFTQALQLVQTGFRQGTSLNETGEITALPGFNQTRANTEGVIAGSKATAKAIGENTGENVASLKSQEAKLPQLEKTVEKLSELGKKATYTQTGQIRDTARRQLGLPVGSGAKARAEYISLVDNQILPLLRDTFGAQFTEREGQSLKVTLGDPNKSPEEKDAVLKSFIDQKKQNIGSLKRQLGQESSSVEPGQYQEGQTATNPKTGQTLTFRGGKWQ